MRQLITKKVKMATDINHSNLTRRQRRSEYCDAAALGERIWLKFEKTVLFTSFWN